MLFRRLPGAGSRTSRRAEGVGVQTAMRSLDHRCIIEPDGTEQDDTGRLRRRTWTSEHSARGRQLSSSGKTLFHEENKNDWH